MASPVLAYTDGAILRQMAPLKPFVMMRIVPPSLTEAWLPRSADFTIPSKVAVNSIVTLDPVEFRVPPPPMGRQIVVTFPSTYREWGAGVKRPDHGLQWPRSVKP